MENERESFQQLMYDIKNALTRSRDADVAGLGDDEVSTLDIEDFARQLGVDIDVFVIPRGNAKGNYKFYRNHIRNPYFDDGSLFWTISNNFSLMPTRSAKRSSPYRGTGLEIRRTGTDNVAVLKGQQIPSVRGDVFSMAAFLKSTKTVGIKLQLEGFNGNQSRGIKTLDIDSLTTYKEYFLLRQSFAQSLTHVVPRLRIDFTQNNDAVITLDGIRLEKRATMSTEAERAITGVTPLRPVDKLVTIPNIPNLAPYRYVEFSYTFPVATGNAPITYRLTGTVPGLTFDADTRILSGTPTTDGTYALTYRAQDNDRDFATRSISASVTILDVNVVLPVIAPQRGRPAKTFSVTLPEVTTGNIPIVYSITSIAVPGLTFDADTRILSGTPTTVGTYNVTYRATDNDGDSAERTFVMTISAGVSFFNQFIGTNKFAIEFDASDNLIDLYEYSPAEGTLISKTPSGMFTDTDIYWIERVRINISNARINMHNGGSTVDSTTFARTWDENWALYIIDDDAEKYVIIQADSFADSGGGYIDWTFDALVTVANTSGATVEAFVSGLAGKHVVVALIPSKSFRPYA